MATRSAPRAAKNRSKVDERFDWRRIARLVLVSRAIDELEETRLVPEKKVLYQFSARGHDLAQVMLGSLLNHPHDGVGERLTGGGIADGPLHHALRESRSGEQPECSRDHSSEPAPHRPRSRCSSSRRTRSVSALSSGSGSERRAR